MKNVRKRWYLGAALALTAGSLAVWGANAKASVTTTSPNACSSSQLVSMARAHGLSGVVPAIGNCATNAAVKTSDKAKGTPPLIWHGGPVMETTSTGPLIITPIYWSPPSHPIPADYRFVINQYVNNVGLASGSTSNVFSVANEYFGTNGQIQYAVKLGTPILDTTALPVSGCDVTSKDTSGIYSDGTGYDACLDDAQVTGEIDRIAAARGLPIDHAHIYVMYLPKHVEACFNPGSTLTADNGCTINYEPSAAFCAYHTVDSSGAFYANMPFPIYLSGTHFTCGTNKNFGSIQSPNGNPDADVEISPTSHEVNEASTDPDTNTGWYDSSGFENGDECAYIFGAVQGTPGQFYNQVIHGGHYLTQEEFSNNDFAITGKGCVQGSQNEA